MSKKQNILQLLQEKGLSHQASEFARYISSGRIDRIEKLSTEEASNLLFVLCEFTSEGAVTGIVNSALRLGIISPSEDPCQSSESIRVYVQTDLTNKVELTWSAGNPLEALDFIELLQLASALAREAEQKDGAEPFTLTLE